MFTVDTVIQPPVVITPSDGGAGGYFIPESQLYSGEPITFTYVSPLHAPKEKV